MLLLAIVTLTILTGLTVARVNYYAEQTKAEHQLSQRFIHQAQKDLK